MVNLVRKVVLYKFLGQNVKKVYFHIFGGHFEKRE